MPLFDQQARDAPEISDLIVDFDAQTLQRLPVPKQPVVERFEQLGRPRAARIVRAIAERDGFLDPAAVDELLITAHYELQRLSEEFDHGRRVAELVSGLLQAIRASGTKPPLRVVDIGCGTGFVVRWLAAFGNLGQDVELIGADYNLALLAEARRLAAAENLDCRFIAANAFQLSEPATVFLSTGTIHHFRGDSLANFFRQHDKPQTMALAHFDFQPSIISPLGAWLFHAIRMRQPLSRHDGYWSNVRAHTGQTLLTAARGAAPDFHFAIYNAKWGPFRRVFHALVGVRGLRQQLCAALGPRARRLGDWAA